MPVPTEMQLVGCKRKYDEMEGVRVGEPAPPYCVQRQSILNISMCKLRTPLSKKEPSLRRSVLIFNTLRFIEQELKQEGFKFMPPPPPIVFPPAEQDMTLDPPPPSPPMMEPVVPSSHCPIPMFEAGEENDVTRDADDESIDEDDDEEEDDVDYCDDSHFMAVTCAVAPAASSSPVGCSPLAAAVTAATSQSAVCNGSITFTPVINDDSQSMNCSTTTCSSSTPGNCVTSSISINNSNNCSSSTSSLLLPSISTLNVTCSLPPVNTFMEPSAHQQQHRLANTTTSGASGATTGSGNATCSSNSSSSSNLTSISDVLLNAVPVLNSTPVATPSKDGPLSPPSSSMSQLFDLDTSKVSSSSSTSLPVSVTSQTQHPHSNNNSSNPVLPHHNTSPGNNQSDCSLLQTLPLVTSITSHLHHTCISNNTSNHPLQQQQQQQQHTYSTTTNNQYGSLNFFSGSFSATAAAAAVSTATGTAVVMHPYTTTTVLNTNTHNNRNNSSSVVSSGNSNSNTNNTSFSDVDMSLYDFDLLASSAPNVKVAPLSAEELMHSFPAESYSGCIGPSPCYKSDFLGDDLDHIMQILVGI